MDRRQQEAVPFLDREALFSDTTENYASPMEPKPGDEIQLRFRTRRFNAHAVYVHVRIGASTDTATYHLRLLGSRGYFDYYGTTLTATAEPISYYFEVWAAEERCYYTRTGAVDLPDEKDFVLVPGFSTPDWAKGAVMYQIFTERFCNGDPKNDVVDGEYSYLGKQVEKRKDWNQLPAADGTREFYGGDLQGIWDKLDYLQELGIEVLYLNPIFVSPSNHKYDTQDYDYVDPHFGVIVVDEGEALPEGRLENRKATKHISRVSDKRNLQASNAFFACFVREVHRRGMKIILDGVFNHCGSFNKWMDRERIYENQEGYEPGAYVSKKSPYHDFFEFTGKEWPYNKEYDGWWGHDTLPKLNYEASKELEEYILRIGEKWVSEPYNVDGWRLDVAADLGHSPEYNHAFWKKFRKRVKAANPNAIILAEHYDDCRLYLAGDEWDTVMNYRAFMEPLTWFFTGLEKHSDVYRPDLHGSAKDFFGAMGWHMAEFLTPSLQVAMNELSNHDHSRFLTRTSSKVGRVGTHGSAAALEGIRPEIMREAVVMQMTWPGAPTLYYGDEVGLCGFTDPDNRRTYPWGREDLQMLEFHRRAIALHKRYPVFTHGSLIFLLGETDCIAYGRFSPDGQMIVAFNNSEERRELTIPAWRAGISEDMVLVRVFATDAEGFSEREAVYPLIGGELRIVLERTSSAVLVGRRID